MPRRSPALTLDRKHIWHPYSALKDYARRDPLMIVKAQGLKLTDAQGRTYDDTLSSWWCNVHGHGHPAIRVAVTRQLERLDHVLFAGITHPPAVELTERLVAWLDPKLRRLFFSDNGSTAVEVALKMAFQYWQNQGERGRTRFLFLDHAYHGDTVGTMSVGGSDLYHRMYAPLCFKAFRAPAPDCSACPRRRSTFTLDARSTGCSLECFQGMQRMLEREGHRLAAVIVEPLLQGSAGMRTYPPEYLRKLARLTRKLGIFLIFDEVATGFGRLGTRFAYQQAGVVPDFLCLSKGLTGGTLPLGITVTREKVYRAFRADGRSAKTFFHGHTYTANPLACAAAAANLKLFDQKRLPESRHQVLRHFHAALRTWEQDDHVADIRYLGWVGAIDLCRSRRRKRIYPAKVRAGFQVYLESLKHGLLLRPLGDTIYWFLPLSVTKAEIDDIMTRSRATIAAVVKRLDRG